MKRWLAPTAWTGLLGAVAMLLPAWSQARRAQTEAKVAEAAAVDAAWKRENGMAFYESAYKDEVAAHQRLLADVMEATSLTELRKRLEEQPANRVP